LEKFLDTAIITSSTDWFETPRMRHYLTWELSKSYNIIYIQLDTAGPTRIKKFNNQITLFNPGGYKRGVSRIWYLYMIHRYLEIKRIKNYLRKNTDTENLILFNFQFDYPDLINCSNFLVEYFIMNDDFLSMTSRHHTKRKKLQEKILKRCKRLITSSEILLQLYAGNKKNACVINSGHNFSKSMPNFQCRSLIKKIKVCYLGFIHDRIQYEWLIQLANDPTFKLTLIGPIEGVSGAKDLLSIGGVTHKSPMTGVKLQKYMEKFDVFVVPYLLCQANTIANVPAKLFQYLACGRPIVSSYTLNVGPLSEGTLYVAKNAEEFISMIKEAVLHDSQEKMQKRIEYAAENTWSSRGQKLRELVQNDIKPL
jgi:glycosyltransferase involved in cell wall biosynthesis